MNYGSARPDHPDAVTYRRAADAFRRKDLETLAQTIHEDITWHFPGQSWVAREIPGRTALLAFLTEIIARTNKTFVLEDHSISGTDHHVVAVQRLGATYKGETKTFSAVSVMRFEGGRQIERWIHLLDPEGFDRFFSQFA